MSSDMASLPLVSAPKTVLLLLLEPSKSKSRARDYLMMSSEKSNAFLSLNYGVSFILLEATVVAAA